MKNSTFKQFIKETKALETKVLRLEKINNERERYLSIIHTAKSQTTKDKYIQLSNILFHLERNLHLLDETNIVQIDCLKRDIKENKKEIHIIELKTNKMNLELEILKLAFK